jgi:hypothetical protein
MIYEQKSTAPTSTSATPTVSSLDQPALYRWVKPIDKETFLTIRQTIKKNVEYLNILMDFYISIGNSFRFPEIRVELERNEQNEWIWEGDLPENFHDNVKNFFKRIFRFEEMTNAAPNVLMSSEGLNKVLNDVCNSTINLLEFCHIYSNTHHFVDASAHTIDHIVELMEEHKSSLQFDKQYYWDAITDLKQNFGIMESPQQLLRELDDAVQQYSSIKEQQKEPIVNSGDGFHIIEKDEYRIVSAMSISTMLIQFFIYPLSHKDRDKRWSPISETFNKFILCLSNFGLSLLKNACYNSLTSDHPSKMNDNGVDITIVSNDALIALYKLLVLSIDADEFCPSEKFKYIDVVRFMISMCNLNTKSFGKNLNNIKIALQYHQHECTQKYLSYSLNQFILFMESVKEELERKDPQNYISSCILHDFFISTDNNLSKLDKFKQTWEIRSNRQFSNQCESFAKDSCDSIYKSLFRFANFNFNRWQTSNFVIKEDYEYRDWHNLIAYQNCNLDSMPLKPKNALQGTPSVTTLNSSINRVSVRPPVRPPVRPSVRSSTIRSSTTRISNSRPAVSINKQSSLNPKKKMYTPQSRKPPSVQTTSSEIPQRSQINENGNGSKIEELKNMLRSAVYDNLDNDNLMSQNAPVPPHVSRLYSSDSSDEEDDRGYNSTAPFVARPVARPYLRAAKVPSRVAGSVIKNEISSPIPITNRSTNATSRVERVERSSGSRVTSDVKTNVDRSAPISRTGKATTLVQDSTLKGKVTHPRFYKLSPKSNKSSDATTPVPAVVPAVVKPKRFNKLTPPKSVSLTISKASDDDSDYEKVLYKVANNDNGLIQKFSSPRPPPRDDDEESL